jgi:hypothetical protein
LIYAGTYSTVLATTTGFFPSGLAGTIGVRIIDSAGTATVARRTTGITEPIASSGFYVASIDLTALSSAPAPGHYFVFWDNAGTVAVGSNPVEDLILHKTTTLSAALREINNVAISHNAENISVGFFVA